jgi:HEPN domain-containing protein
MSQINNGSGQSPFHSDDGNIEELEQILIQGVSLQQRTSPASSPLPVSDEEDDDENGDVVAPTRGAADTRGSDIQGALGLFAEAAQDMATAGVELGLGRHFACADFCNQAVEKAAQAVSLLRFGRRSMYDHDLGTLGVLVGAPPEIQDKMAILTPFHPESFYADTPPEEADEVISAEQARNYVDCARQVIRWARNIILHS